MKIKTNELTDAALDWAVGDIVFKRLIAQGSHVKQWVLEQHNAGTHTDPWSSNWLFGGPIIEREKIQVNPSISSDAWGAANPSKDQCVWVWAETPLIAAMRVYVASKLGDTIEVPEALG